MRHRSGGSRATALTLFSSMLLAATSPLLGQHTEKPEVRLPSTSLGPGKPDTTSESDARSEQRPNSQPAGGFRSWLEQRVRSFESKSDREQGVTVSFGTVTPGSGIAGGIGYKHFNAFRPGLGYQVGGMLSFRRYQSYSAAFGRLNARSSTVELDTADRRV